MPLGIFLQLEVDFDEDESVAKLARYTRAGEARACRDLLVAMWRHCKRKRTDGHVPLEVVGKLAYPDTAKIALRDADRLVECGIAERTDAGYFLPGYLKHNKSRAVIAAESEEKAKAGKKGGERSGEVRRAKANVKQGASVGLNTETETYTEAPTEPPVEALRGNRNDTLRTGSATEPTCQRHPHGDGGTACGGCAKVREWGDRNQSRAARDADHRRSQAVLADIAATRSAAVPRPKETTQ